MSKYTLITLTVPSTVVELYRDAAGAVHNAGAGMFVTPLYTGSEITHYISTGMIDVEFIAAVTNPEDFAVQVGVSLVEAQWFKDNFTYCVVGNSTGEDDPILFHGYEAVELLGLSLIPVYQEEVTP